MWDPNECVAHPSEAHFRAAHGTDEFRRTVTQPGWEEFPSSPMLYQVITEVG
jgi:hypothetical protein